MKLRTKILKRFCEKKVTLIYNLALSNTWQLSLKSKPMQGIKFLN